MVSYVDLKRKEAPPLAATYFLWIKIDLTIFIQGHPHNVCDKKLSNWANCFLGEEV